MKDIVFADNVAVSETANGCEYTCNDGYRLSTGPCSATTISSISCTSAPTITVSDPTGTVDGTQATATYVAPSPANSLSGVSDAIITEAGSGYNGDPIVSFTGGNCNFYPNAKATADLATGKITSVHLEAK
ncbi:hypothetical protein H6768_03835 [Candidatus Peribacteria bacterium]|nr:hypothetical protein [Candidatus Peribacteria bacterium]